MDIPTDLLCVFNTELDERDGRYVLEVPTSEVNLGEIQRGGMYRVGILRGVGNTGGSGPHRSREQSTPSPPVQEPETRVVEIENLGDQGDGITRIERGFVVIVPDTEPGEKVEIEITDVRENLAFGEVVERLHDVG